MSCMNIYKLYTNVKIMLSLMPSILAFLNWFGFETILVTIPARNAIDDADLRRRRNDDADDDSASTVPM